SVTEVKFPAESNEIASLPARMLTVGSPNRLASAGVKKAGVRPRPTSVPEPSAFAVSFPSRLGGQSHSSHDTVISPGPHSCPLLQRSGNTTAGPPHAHGTRPDRGCAQIENYVIVSMVARRDLRSSVRMTVR